MRCKLVVLAILAGCGSGCGSSAVRPAAPADLDPILALPDSLPFATLAVPAPAPEPAPATATAAVSAPYPDEVRSVRFVRTAVVRKAPRGDAEPAGIVAIGTLAGVADAADGPGCRDHAGAPMRWIAIVPRGWACEAVLEPTTELPTATFAPSLTDDDDPAARSPVPGIYGVIRGAGVTAYASASDAIGNLNGRVLAGSNTVRARAVVQLDGRRYWRTTTGELIDESAIVQISPSRFKGVAITDPEVMPAWARSHRDPRAPVATRSAPSLRAPINGALAARAVVSVSELSADGQFVAVGAGAWVPRADVKIATRTAPPPGTAAGEKWFDVDRDEQVLVAYEGERPVYATLVSTGKYQHETPVSVARVMTKLETAVMTSDKADAVYSVADVPWTMYYDHDFALHTSYWHDGFGSPRSHGCINLAPRDARALYQWSSPDVPPGWTAVYADADNPGSLVRVRTQRVPAPAFRGYARTMLSALR